MKIVAALSAAICFMAFTAAGHAQDASGAPPDLVGTWVVVKAEGAFGTQIVDTLPRAELIIDMQDGAVFAGRAEHEVGEDDPDFRVGDEPVRVASEPLTGIVGWDNVSLTIVEREDTSVWTGSLLNNDTMALIYFEPGAHAFVARQILVRQ
ncbi:hypothetical protein [Bauldia sp.]|uniref:hypothetical protein n=1 Tax=Bauldia sp. TaxID=2575872 RepID=UPI003BAAF131